MPFLMNKDRVLAEIDMEYGHVIRIARRYNEAPYPFFLEDNLTINALNEWLEQRRMPEERYGLKETREMFNWYGSSSHMASLTDHYWIRHSKKERYCDVGFFERYYPEQVGDAFFNPWRIMDAKSIGFDSPDLTCGGKLKKRWIQKKTGGQAADYTSYLRKTGERRLHQFPIVEVIVSKIASDMNIISCVDYTLVIDGMELCSECANFVTLNTEFVPASELVMKSGMRPEGMTAYEHMLILGKKFGIKQLSEFLDAMIYLDTLVYNTDRNYGNFGFLRDPDTGRFISPAPLFDNGSSLFKWNRKKRLLFSDDRKEAVTRAKNKYGEKRIDGIVDTAKVFDSINRCPGIDSSIKEDIKRRLDPKNIR